MPRKIRNPRRPSQTPLLIVAAIIGAMIISSLTYMIINYADEQKNGPAELRPDPTPTVNAVEEANGSLGQPVAVPTRTAAPTKTQSAENRSLGQPVAAPTPTTAPPQRQVNITVNSTPTPEPTLTPAEKWLLSPMPTPTPVPPPDEIRFAFNARMNEGLPGDSLPFTWSADVSGATAVLAVWNDVALGLPRCSLGACDSSGTGIFIIPRDATPGVNTLSIVVGYEDAIPPLRLEHSRAVIVLDAEAIPRGQHEPETPTPGAVSTVITSTGKSVPSCVGTDGATYFADRSYSPDGTVTFSLAGKPCR